MFIQRYNRDRTARMNTRTATTRSAAFWRPDGTLNAPISGSLITELDRQDIEIEDDANEGNESHTNYCPFVHGTPEVSGDSHAKKNWVSVTLQDDKRRTQSSLSDDAQPGFSGSSTPPGFSGSAFSKYNTHPLNDYLGSVSLQTVFEGDDSPESSARIFQESIERSRRRSSFIGLAQACIEVECSKKIPKYKGNRKVQIAEDEITTCSL